MFRIPVEHAGCIVRVTEFVQVDTEVRWRNRCVIYCIFQPIRHTVIFSLKILEKNNDECILILVIYWKKTGLLHTKISNYNIIYSS